MDKVALVMVIENHIVLLNFDLDFYDIRIVIQSTKKLKMTSSTYPSFLGVKGTSKNQN